MLQYCSITKSLWYEKITIKSFSNILKLTSTLHRKLLVHFFLWLQQKLNASLDVYISIQVSFAEIRLKKHLLHGTMVFKKDGTIKLYCGIANYTTSILLNTTQQYQ